VSDAASRELAFGRGAAGLRAAETTRPRNRSAAQLELTSAAPFLLAFAIVLYLALQGGGYDLVVRNQVGIAVWWGVFCAALAGLLPARQLGPAGRLAVTALCLLCAWSAVASTWSASAERSLAEVSREACYLGVLILGLLLQRRRRGALAAAAGGVASAIVLVALLSVISRLEPGSFPAARQTASLLPGAAKRLSWPLDYWNALAALMALGVPLLLGIASSARRLTVQAAAAAAIPVLALCGYLTFSRGGALAAAVALVVFFALSPDRVPKLASGLLVSGASAVVIAGAVHRPAVENALTGAGARHAGGELLLTLLLVCAGTALAQTGIGLAARHGSPPRWLRVRRRAALTAVAVVAVAAAVTLAAGGAGFLSREWRAFKRPTAAALSKDELGRYGVASGNGRYQLWRAAVQAASKRPLTGWGPGTYALLWPPRAPFYSPVQNAHSLYLETLAEQGAIGLALLAAFLAGLVFAAWRAALRDRRLAGAHGAAVCAGLCAFLVSAAFDWVWQVPALPVAALMLGAGALASGRVGQLGGRRGRAGARLALCALAVCSLVAIALPLAETTAIRGSQSEAAAGNRAQALGDAFTAARLEPYAAGPQLQLALVLETQNRVGSALAHARRAVADEPLNWASWLVLSRLEAEDGQPARSLAAFERARALNPRSPLFRAT
jgi:hypothetical protein